MNDSKHTPGPLDTLTESSYGSPRNRARNPYERLPERDMWTEHEVYTRPDGSTYRRVREVSRWAGSFSYGDWTVADAPECTCAAARMQPYLDRALYGTGMSGVLAHLPECPARAAIARDRGDK